MTERRFNRFFDTCTSRGSRFAATSCACNESACENNNSISLLSLDTALAVSIFAALRLIIIRIARIAASIIVLVAAVVVARRSNTEPGMVPAH